MSGEYYSNGEVGECSNFRDDYNLQTNRTNHADRRNCDGDDGTCTKRSQDYQLHDIEEQLELAENRCNTLKGQLEFMKKNYQRSSSGELGSGTSKWKNRKRPVSTHPAKNQFELDTYENLDVYPRRSSSSFPLQSESPAKSALVRQNSTSIGTDHTGAAVRTINNILSGITNSVNGATQSNGLPFLNDIGATCAIPGGPFSPRLKKRLQEQQKRVDRLVQDARFSSVNDVKGCSVEEISGEDTQDAPLDKWAKSVTSQMKNKAQGSSGTINLPKFAKSRQMDDDLRKRRRSIKRLKPVSKLSIIKKLSDSEAGKQINKLSGENLVEIYHNLAAKSSESDDSHKAHQHARQGAGDLPNKATGGGALSPIQENAIVRSDYFKHVPRNYEQQTVASKLKRVTKNYLRSFNYFNFRCIPFCAAKSTSPSHNIGINIQQVMSIIKTRQPITGISPTLAHNISLAAEKLQGSPLSTFVSNLSTRIGSGTCPLTKHSLNYNKLQEMAKAIPEEEETVAENLPDVEVPPPVPPIWTSEPSTGRCTCVPKNGVPFQKVVSRYQVSNANNLHSSSKLIKPARRPEGVTSKQRTAAWVSTTTPTESKPSGVPEQNHFAGNEKSLKTVLKNLHDEFDSLNAKYETLSKTSTNAAPEVLKQLEEMDTQLNQKEEEIKMVMSLCTEVMALKDQVKKLKERASCEALSECKASDPKKEPNAALHLTQLLRQIQNYQKQFQGKD
ncbi:uncharacterized protein LOC116180163 isoform X2 [Photinus pyralis]|uniref:uncharacterized protein LOC116180163 isoform X2 n=1 Tax=Photinus pyralis TaxID=7054 RepID=UPI0012671A59|nr:uncharacterized protein LOC116180163 isoform X2 [Photinus pyralis]